MKNITKTVAKIIATCNSKEYEQIGPILESYSDQRLSEWREKVFEILIRSHEDHTDISVVIAKINDIHT